jgi:hypothetical protein
MNWLNESRGPTLIPIEPAFSGAGANGRIKIMAQIALQIPDGTGRTDQLAIDRRATALVRHPQLQPALLEATSVHPVAVLIPIAAFAWFVIAAWIGFAGDREAAVSIFMVGFVNVMLFGLLAGGGWYSRNMMPERATTRSFRDFLHGPVDIATGRITGREAMLQIVALPVCLSIGGSIIVALAVWCGVGG